MQLGAQLLVDPGYGDDGTPNGGVFADFDHWIESSLLPKLPKSIPGTTVSDIQFQSSYSVKVSEVTSASPEQAWQSDAFQSFFESVSPITAYHYSSEPPMRNQFGTVSQPLIGTLIQNERITAANWEQDTRHLRIQVPMPQPKSASRQVDSLPYQAGDVVSILPSNDPEEVNQFLRVLPTHIQEKADYQLELEFRSEIETNLGVGYEHWPGKCTLRTWLTYCADIHALPEREDLRALSYFCSSSHEFGSDQALKLRSLSETSESALYADYILREKRSWAEVLYDFDSLRAEGSLLTIVSLMSLLSPIRVRDFSIASSPTEEWMLQKEGSNDIFMDLCVAVVQGTTPLGRVYHGLCSRHLASLSTNSFGAKLRLWIRPGTFHGLPLDMSGQKFASPVLCVGAGTGVAPLRSLIRERVAVLRLATGDESTGADNILIFGCRKESADFYYEEEWKSMVQSQSLELLTAFSRDQWHKVYVQQVLQKSEKEKQLLSQHILHRNGSVYIAGGPSMAKTVKEVIVEILAEHVEGGEKRATLLLNQLQRLGRFNVEAWG